MTPIPIVDMAASPSIVSIAWQHQIPIYHIDRLSAAETVDTLARLQADVACVACFPKRIPSALLGVPRRGFLNVHPSLLPRYRGPYPLFWMLRHGDRRFGVTIHFMDEQWDSGDIAAQAEVDLPDGFSSAEADRTLSQYGAEPPLEALRRLEKGQPTRRPQPAGGAYFPAPQESDFVIDTAWPAQRAFNFMRGTDDWQRCIRLKQPESASGLSRLCFTPAAKSSISPTGCGASRSTSSFRRASCGRPARNLFIQKMKFFVYQNSNLMSCD